MTTQAHAEKAPVLFYTADNCVRCEQTKRMLDRADVQYQTINVNESEDVAETLRTQGFSALPVVVAPETSNLGSWSGFNLAKIKALISFQASKVAMA